MRGRCYAPRLFQRVLHRQQAGVSKAGELLHPSFQRVDDLVFVKLLVLVNHLLFEHKHSHFLWGGGREVQPLHV